VLLVNFTESQVQLREQAAMFGMDFASAEAAGLLRLVAVPAFDIDVDRIAYDLSEDIERREVRRLVIDSIAELERATDAQGRTADFLAALVTYLRARDVTSYLTLDTPSLVGPELTLADSPLAVVAENLLLVRRSEYRGYLRRLLSILKMRYSEHDHAIHEYVIHAQRGIEIIGAVPPAEG
jgi:circadian clock protein KaiC